MGAYIFDFCIMWFLCVEGAGGSRWFFSFLRGACVEIFFLFKLITVLLTKTRISLVMHVFATASQN